MLTLGQIVSLCSQSIFKEVGAEIRYQQMSDEIATRLMTELQFLGNKCARIEIYLNSVDRMQFRFDILQLNTEGFALPDSTVPHEGQLVIADVHAQNGCNYKLCSVESS